MIIHQNIKSKFESEFENASSIWIVSAMISNNGWDLFKRAIPQAI